MCGMAKNEKRLKSCQISIEGMDCATCAGKIEKGLNNLDGVECVDVSIGAEKASIEYDPRTQSVSAIIDKITELGYKARETGRPGTPNEVRGFLEVEQERRRHFKADALRLLFVSVVTALSLSGLLRSILPFDVALIGVVVGSIPIVKEGYFSLMARNITVETFMSLAIFATVAIGEFIAASVIVIFLLVADVIENVTVERARSAIKELVKIAPMSARVVRGREEVEVDISEISVGDRIVVKTGERIPVDGLIVYGGGSIDQSAITGESLHVEKSEGDHVFAGTINVLGLLIIETHKIGSETTLAKIIELVEEAESAKAPVQRLADRFVSYFTPVVLGIALLTLLVSRNVVFAISVIVVACPCSVAIATPLAVVASFGKAARRGIVIKGGRILENLARIDTVVMDKTGTLTVGEPRVTDIKGFDGHDEGEIMRYAAITEKFSEHSLARAIINKGKEFGIAAPDPESFEVLPGKGVVANSAGDRILLGSPDFMRESGISIGEEVDRYLINRGKEAKTAMLIAHDGRVCGAISVLDVVREQTKGAIRCLRDDLKIRRLIMLTGDNRHTAEVIAGEVGIDEFYAELLPEQKVEKVRELKRQGARVAMVGDGINDAPALAAADVGIAMGVAGADVAIEAADVALMHDDWFHLVDAILIGRRTFKTIRQNLWISMLFNVVGVSLASIGILTPILAAIAHILPDVGVFLNSSRQLLRPSRYSS